MEGQFLSRRFAGERDARVLLAPLPAVEINNTFYRLPQPNMVENWSDQVPETFRFSIKATQRITHFKRLNNCAEETKFLMETAHCCAKD